MLLSPVTNGVLAGDLVLVQAIETAGVSFDTLEGAGWSLHEATVRIDHLDARHGRSVAGVFFRDPTGSPDRHALTRAKGGS